MMSIRDAKEPRTEALVAQYKFYFSYGGRLGSRWKGFRVVKADGAAKIHWILNISDIPLGNVQYCF